MEFSVVAVVLIYSLFRSWQNAIFPFVLLVFVNALEYWLRLRSQFFFEYTAVLDIFCVLLIGLSLARNALPDLKQHLRLNKVEIALFLVIGYSWLSYTWSPGAELVETINPNFLRDTFIKQLIFLVMLPMAFRASIDKHDGFERDLKLVGLTMLPLIALTTDWHGRGASYHFTVIDPATDMPKNALNPLGLASFSVVLIIFAACYMRNTLRSIVTLGTVCVLAFYLLIETQSRGQLLSVVLCLPLILMFLYPKFRTRHLFVVGPLLLLPLAALALNFATIMTASLELVGFSESILKRLATVHMDSGISGRINAILTVAEAWWSSTSAILFGLGTAAGYHYAGGYVHNVLLDVLFDQGIIIFTIFAFAIYCTFFAIAGMLNIDNLSKNDRRLVVFLSALFLCELLTSMKQGALYNTFELQMIMLFCFILSDHLNMKYALRGAPTLVPLGQQGRVQLPIFLGKEI